MRTAELRSHPGPGADGVPGGGQSHRRYLPVGLDLQDRHVLVIGGDEEAERKVRTLLAYGAKVTVVSPSLTEGLAAIAAVGAVAWKARRFRVEDLEEVFLAVVCDREEARDVVPAARLARVLVNVLDEAASCDVIAMASVTRGALEVAIHTSGQSAALSRRLREYLDGLLPASLAEIVAVLGQLRPAARSRLPGPEERRAFWLQVVDEAFVAKALAGEVSAETLRERITHCLRAASWEVPGT